MITTPVSELPPNLKEVSDNFNNLILNHVDANFWVAGGIFRKIFNDEAEPTDIDLYFKDAESFYKVDKYLRKLNYCADYESTNSKKLKLNDLSFDLVKRFFPSPQETIKDFDFTICCCALSRNELVYTTRIILSI